VGLGLGLGGAVIVGRLLRSVLVQTEPSDPVTLIAISGILVLVAAVASWWPSSQAMRLDPAVALRDE
jgi:ABC-type antimicrobial peptide transport system permease subunit